MKAKTRKREVVQARQLSMFLAKHHTKNSLKSIGQFFGGRDHSTVIHSCQAIQNLMDTDKKFKKSVEDIEKKIKMSTAWCFNAIIKKRPQSTEVFFFTCNHFPILNILI